jgi:hypothetical protein
MAALESVRTFGPDRTLVGVLTTPGPQQAGAQHQVACLLLNVGINHRIGPRRINVKAARRLADAGIASLRFDLSGVGDSPASAGRQDFRAQALADMRAALDQLQAATGASRFLVFGICSGAVNALSLALGDARVVGLTMLDGHVFPSKAVRIRRKLRRWSAFPFNPAVRRSYAGWNDWADWARAPFDPQARRKAIARLFGRSDAASTEDTGLYDANAPRYGAAEFERDMAVLVDREVDISLMFTATVVAVDHDRDLMRQLAGSPALSKVRYRFWPEIDHTVTALAAQRALLDALTAWAIEVAHAKASPGDAAPPQPAASRGMSGARVAALSS